MASTTKTWVNNSAPTCEDSDLNGFKNENNNLIVGSGQALNTGDLQQTHKAVAQYSTDGDFFTDSGAANAYILTSAASRVAPSSYTDRMVLRFLAANDNTGASTVNLAGIGIKNIKAEGGADVPSGYITGVCEIVFDAGSDFFVLSDKGVGSPGQTWQSVTRTSGVQYTNSTGRPIMISVDIVTTGNNVSGSATINIDGTSFSLARAGGIIVGQTASTGAVIIPNGADYTITDAGISRSTVELR